MKFDKHLSHPRQRPAIEKSRLAAQLAELLIHIHNSTIRIYENRDVGRY